METVKILVHNNVLEIEELIAKYTKKYYKLHTFRVNEGRCFAIMVYTKKLRPKINRKYK